MSLVSDRTLSAREFLDECIAFKRDHPAQSRFLRGLVMGKPVPSYLQRYSRIGFVSHLAFLDILFNWGPYSTAILWGTPPPVAVGTTP